jgi:lipid-binding SYLF domain-containing protein
MQEQKTSKLRSTGIALALALACTAFVGCTTTKPGGQGSSQTQRQQINSGVDSTLSRLYQQSPNARDLVQRARGVLVFPSVLSGGFMVAGEYGRGALRVNGETQGYYSTTAGSIGFQAGAESKAIVLLFMTDDALTKFKNSNGWTVGADATVTLVNVGANGSIDSNTVRQPVVGFVMTNGGLMAGVSLQGAKISRISY